MGRHNRLISFKVGNRAKAVMGSSTTVYIGAYYEKMTSGSSTTITKYYQAGGQRIALRVNGVVRWLATDHLGSGTATCPTPAWNANANGVTTYAYDVADRLLQMTGPDGAVTTITYDLLGRKTSMNDPDMGAWSYTYDTAGNLVAQTDARNVTIGFGYDGLNRLTQKWQSGSSSGM
ncbi:MAG: hypothetical protein WAW20_10080, partial [Anaerolineae bacterium]